MIQQDWNRSMGTEVSANANRESAETANAKPGGWIHWEKGIKPDKEWQYMIPKDTARNKALNSYPPDHSINIQFSRSVVSNSLRPHGLQHARLPCSLPTPRAYSNSGWWCHPTISSPVIPFSSCLQSFTVSGSFPVHQFLTSGGQIGVSASTSVLPMNTFRTDLL